MLEHFRPEERPLVERTLDWIEQVSRKHQLKLSDFLDPREQFIVRSIAGQKKGLDIHFQFYGGYPQAERQRACLFPEYVQVSATDMGLVLLRLEVAQKQGVAFEHRDLLGSLLGLGIKREKIGDILLTAEETQVVVVSEIASFVELHLQQIGRSKVQARAIPWEEIRVPEEEWMYQQTTVSSLRLDTILSEALRMSRTKITPLIRSGKVKVNWRVTDQAAYRLEEGDQLSVRGFGRFLLAKIEGLTKKERYRVQLGRKE